MGGFPLLSNTQTLEGVTVYSLRYVVCCFLSFFRKIHTYQDMFGLVRRNLLSMNTMFFGSCFNEWKTVNNKVFLIHKKIIIKLFAKTMEMNCRILKEFHPPVPG